MIYSRPLKLGLLLLYALGAAVSLRAGEPCEVEYVAQAVDNIEFDGRPSFDGPVWPVADRNVPFTVIHALPGDVISYGFLGRKTMRVLGVKNYKVHGVTKGGKEVYVDLNEFHSTRTFFGGGSITIGNVWVTLKSRGAQAIPIASGELHDGDQVQFMFSSPLYKHLVSGIYRGTKELPHRGHAVLLENALGEIEEFEEKEIDTSSISHFVDTF